MPFCSKRCQLLDLGAWLTEKMRLPGKPLEEMESAKVTEANQDDEVPGREVQTEMQDKFKY